MDSGDREEESVEDIVASEPRIVNQTMGQRSGEKQKSVNERLEYDIVDSKTRDHSSVSVARRQA
eukprot:658039-Prorocentrum_lima.AAC.1